MIDQNLPFNGFTNVISAYNELSSYLNSIVKYNSLNQSMKVPIDEKMNKLNTYLKTLISNTRISGNYNLFDLETIKNNIENKVYKSIDINDNLNKISNLETVRDGLIAQIKQMLDTLNTIVVTKNGGKKTPVPQDISGWNKRLNTISKDISKKNITSAKYQKQLEDYSKDVKDINDLIFADPLYAQYSRGIPPAPAIGAPPPKKGPGRPTNASKLQAKQTLQAQKQAFAQQQTQQLTRQAKQLAQQAQQAQQPQQAQQLTQQAQQLVQQAQAQAQQQQGPPPQLQPNPSNLAGLVQTQDISDPNNQNVSASTILAQNLGPPQSQGDPNAKDTLNINLPRSPQQPEQKRDYTFDDLSKMSYNKLVILDKNKTERDRILNNLGISKQDWKDAIIALRPASLKKVSIKKTPTK
jgi:hypothetical protein